MEDKFNELKTAFQSNGFHIEAPNNRAFVASKTVENDVFYCYVTLSQNERIEICQTVNHLTDGISVWFDAAVMKISYYTSTKEVKAHILNEKYKEYRIAVKPGVPPKFYTDAIQVYQ